MPPAEAIRLHRPTSIHAALQAAKSFGARFSSPWRHALGSSGPILFRLTLHRWCFWVLHLEPIAQAVPVRAEPEISSIRPWLAQVEGGHHQSLCGALRRRTDYISSVRL